LLIVNVIWGSTFIMVDTAVETVSVFVFLALRFGIAFLALLIFFAYFLIKKPPTKADLWRGVLIGVFLFGGYTFQTFGLQCGTGPGKAGFITGLSVVLVPIFSAIILKKKPHSLSWLGIAIAVIGLGLLSFDTGWHFGISDIKGDFLVLAGAICFAFHIISIDRFIQKSLFIPLTVFQVGTTAVLSWLLTVTFWGRSFPIVFNSQVLFAVIFTGLVATALIYATQTFVQKRTSPTHVAVIFATEPVFAAIFAVSLTTETFLLRQWGGCALILAAMLFQQILDIFYIKDARAKKEPLKNSNTEKKEESKTHSIEEEKTQEKSV
ncbi:MAG: hypothetical protein DRP02_00005, partial [Candidatus Gerdarchaeota archaeon]